MEMHKESACLFSLACRLAGFLARAPVSKSRETQTAGSPLAGAKEMRVEVGCSCSLVPWLIEVQRQGRPSLHLFTGFLRRSIASLS